MPVSAPKNYNFESNSQPFFIYYCPIASCFRAEKLQFWKQFTTMRFFRCSQRTCFRAEKLQFWKQFTTVPLMLRVSLALFPRRKITILKAIHNIVTTQNIGRVPVSAPKNYNFESNSQHMSFDYLFSMTCFRAEKLQFWKQFTTEFLRKSVKTDLFPRRKITILKAIHNAEVNLSSQLKPVSAPKNYNFESNSQLVPLRQKIL